MSGHIDHFKVAEVMKNYFKTPNNCKTVTTFLAKHGRSENSPANEVTKKKSK